MAYYKISPNKNAEDYNYFYYLDFDSYNSNLNALFANNTSAYFNNFLFNGRIDAANYMFYNCRNLKEFKFTNDFSVNTATYMFSYCYNFNQPVNNIFKYTNIASYAFYQCTNFNQPVTCTNLQYAEKMFSCCYNFNQPVGKTFGSNLEANSVVSTAYMFEYCQNFNQNVWFSYNGTVENCISMFDYCPNLKNKNIYFYAKYNGITNLRFMFRSCNGNLNIHIYGSTVRSIDTNNMFSNLWNKGLRINIYLGNKSLRTDSYWRYCMPINVQVREQVTTHGIIYICDGISPGGYHEVVDGLGGCPPGYNKAGIKNYNGTWTSYQNVNYSYLRFTNNSSNGCMYNESAGIYIY